MGKVETVPWQKVTEGVPFMVAKNLPTHSKYDLFTRTPSGANFYGTETPVSLPEKCEVIALNETTFRELPAESQWVSVSSARKIHGIIAPQGILIKNRESKAQYLDMSDDPGFPINDSEEVIFLGNLFNFRRIPIAELNI